MKKLIKIIKKIDFKKIKKMKYYSSSSAASLKG